MSPSRHRLPGHMEVLHTGQDAACWVVHSPLRTVSHETLSAPPFTPLQTVLIDQSLRRVSRRMACLRRQTSGAENNGLETDGPRNTTAHAL